MGNRVEAGAKLTAKQRKLAYMLADPENTLTVTEKCAEVGISRTTFYNWRQDEEFMAYINRLIEAYADSEIGTVWRALIKKASSGDVSALKLYFDQRSKHSRPSSGGDEVIIISGENELGE